MQTRGELEQHFRHQVRMTLFSVSDRLKSFGRHYHLIRNNSATISSFQSIGMHWTYKRLARMMGLPRRVSAATPLSDQTALGKRSGRFRDHRPVGSWNEKPKRVVISPVGVRQGALMFGITYVINGHKVEPRTRVAAKELPETIELCDAPALQPSLEDSRRSTEGKDVHAPPRDHPVPRGRLTGPQ
jgi:hypothetical protein